MTDTDERRGRRAAAGSRRRRRAGKRGSLAVKRPSGARKAQPGQEARRGANHPGGAPSPSAACRDGWHLCARRNASCLDAAVPSLLDAFHRRRARHVRPTAGAAATRCSNRRESERGEYRVVAAAAPPEELINFQTRYESAKSSPIGVSQYLRTPRYSTLLRPFSFCPYTASERAIDHGAGGGSGLLGQHVVVVLY